MKFVGFFRELEHGSRQRLPSIIESRNRLSPENAAKVTAYLREGAWVAPIMEFVRDPFQPTVRKLGVPMPGVPGGSSLISDGVWIWRLDLAYFVENYRIGLPTEFIEHALSFDITKIDIPSIEAKLDEYWKEYQDYMQKMEIE